jgi:acetolactate synthase I/II/III large subunit
MRDSVEKHCVGLCTIRRALKYLGLSYGTFMTDSNLPPDSKSPSDTSSTGECRSPRGADLLVKALIQQKVERIYTLSGNHIMSIFDASIGTGIRLIHTRHEASCVHMADAQGRLTGVPAVAMVTGGPGHANALGALYTALMAESPLVLLSGQSPINQTGKGAFQEIDQVALAAPVSKAAWSVRDVACLHSDLRLAFKIAGSGRHGPVSLSLPSDLLESLAVEQSSQPSAGAPKFPFAATDSEQASDQQCRAAISWLAAGKSPLILAGAMMLTPARRAAIAALEQSLGIPVIAMDSPRGTDDPRLGRFATQLALADRVLLLAKRVDFTLRFGSAPVFSASCEFMQLEPDPLELERARRNLGARLVEQHCSDPHDALVALSTCELSDPLRLGHAQWSSAVSQACAARPSAWAQIAKTTAQALHPVQIGRVLAQLFQAHPEAILIVDGGEFSQWVQACVDPPRRVINGPAGAIGAALPMALAARAVEPHAPVVALMGDGGFGFHPTEFDTAVRAGLPFVVIIGNDQRWNAEYQIQLRQYGADRLLGCELSNPDYQQFSIAFGGSGVRISSEEQLHEQLLRAIGSHLPCCLNVNLAGLAAPVMKA